MENKIEIYQTKDNQAQVRVQFNNDTVWLSQKMMAQLFQTTVPNINMHLKSIYEVQKGTQKKNYVE